MWRSRLTRWAAPLAFGVVAGWGGSGPGGSGPPPPAAEVVNPLPPDPDQQLVTGRCVICHSLEMIAQQRQTRAEWTVILDRMIIYGMPMAPGDRERILAYLVKHLGQ
ncbi:MAG: hypothetical protein L0027_00130 [Candidatus Rokubacteria bacterium]|nr:hypothetical protein [Candidatus Rokubacteria bacterium]